MALMINFYEIDGGDLSALIHRGRNMDQMRKRRGALRTGCLTLAVALLVLCQTLHAAPGYVMGQAMNVNVVGQTVQFAAGQSVSVLGIVNGMAMVRVTLPGGSQGIAQVPASALIQQVLPGTAAPRPATVPASTPTPAPAPFSSPGFPSLGGADSSTDLGADLLANTPGVKIYDESKARQATNQFAVYIPATYKASAPMPLVVSAHGNGGNGPGEVKQWQKFADEIGFIVVCPSFLSSVIGTNDNLKSDDKMLTNVMKRVLGSFAIDRKHVLFTGFSGGGVPAWYLASKEADIFTALCFRSGNFNGDGYYNVKASFQKWRHRPVYMYLAEHDAGPVNGEEPAALAFLQKRVDAKNLKYELLPVSGHQSRPELAAKWFQTVIQAPDNPDASL